MGVTDNLALVAEADCAVTIGRRNKKMRFRLQTDTLRRKPAMLMPDVRRRTIPLHDITVRLVVVVPYQACEMAHCGVVTEAVAEAFFD